MSDNWFIDSELETVKSEYEKIQGATLDACVPDMVRISIYRTEYKQVAVCFIFPEDYPDMPIITEIKSKTMSFKFTTGLAQLCDEEVKKMLGEEQIMHVLLFVAAFLDENPLCVCSDEISWLKQNCLKQTDRIKLNQQMSQVIVKFKEGSYKMTFQLTVPDNYPFDNLGIECIENLFPADFHNMIKMQAIEIARKCVTPPIKPKPKQPKWKLTPSVKPVIEFLDEIFHYITKQTCALCKKAVLPDNPENVITEPKHELHADKLYCDHYYHYGCLDAYMKTPPFEGGKKCLSCNERIFHDKWKLPPTLIEKRWAHKQARQRELDEVVEFMQ